MSAERLILVAILVAAGLGLISATLTTDLVIAGSDQRVSDKVQNADLAWQMAGKAADTYATKNQLTSLIHEEVNVVEFGRMQPGVRVAYVGQHQRLIFFADGHYRPAKD